MTNGNKLSLQKNFPNFFYGNAFFTLFVIPNSWHSTSNFSLHKLLLLSSSTNLKAKATINFQILFKHNTSHKLISNHNTYYYTRMSDIAMLVTEEYERRVKSLRKFVDNKAREIDMCACVSVMVSNLSPYIRCWCPSYHHTLGQSNTFVTFS